MASLSSELRNIFGDDFDEHSLSEDDSPSTVFETSANEAYKAQAQGPQSNHTENEANDVVPGMIFSSLDCLFVSYQEHARLKGFCVVKRTSKRAVEGDEYKYARMVFDKSGSSRANKTSKRVGCTARLNAIRHDNGSCVISKMVTEHNHQIDPTFSPLMPAHRQLNVHMKRQLEANDIAGIRPCKNVRICEVQSGGPQNLGCLPMDYRNFVDQRRRLWLGDGDAEAIRATYEEFHDVMSFDTTYLGNRYKMSFASIVGVNHHGHSILLGCALVTHEDAESFRWIFQNWLQSMNEKIKHVGNFDRCNVDFKGIVYDSLTIKNFETQWAEFLVKYHWDNNVWLTSLYNEGAKWVPVYLHETFWAGMISTKEPGDARLF
ncbi:hypothetical protein ACS0TY_024153 [Phlomoides rotata]